MARLNGRRYNRAMASLREADLYDPVKTFLEAQGYRVKGEVEGCDLVAVREEEAPVVVELKTSFNLPLLFQGIDRKAISDDVYLAIPAPERRAVNGLWRRHYWDIVRLCRLLGLGLIAVRLRRSGRATVEVHLDPGPYRPRKNKPRRTMLLREFERRVGDPTPGGSNKRPIVTSYRQDALRCAVHLAQHGASRPADVRAGAAVGRAPQILLRDVYGWFHRVERGVYDLTPNGRGALETYRDVIVTLMDGATDAASPTIATSDPRAA